jgi:glutamate-1-semialdehyde 2,1-aminomutase
MKTYNERLNSVIPGGAHTYSRGFDQYSSNTPPILSSGKGVNIFSPEGKKFLDYGMALRAVILGYAYDEVDEAAIKEIRNGNNLTRPSTIELEAAELLVDLVDSVDMVKFAKNGSSAVSAAVKLARAYTGRDLVARCLEHPFFSYDDWFIGSTPLKKGIPLEVIKQTLTFNYNNISSLEQLFELHPGKISSIILEPSTLCHPAPSKYVKGENFLHDVKKLCEKNGAVFILDEMITGFRWDLKGAQHYYKIEPDLCTFGKAMANGFSIAAVAGKKEIMELGGILKEGQERVFLMSTTHGAEMCGLGAFVKTIEVLKRDKVVDHLWNYGRNLIEKSNEVIRNKNLSDYIRFEGIECSPHFVTLDRDHKVSLPFRTLFQQEMIKSGVMMPWIALSFAHGEVELNQTLQALSKTLDIYARALEDGWERHLEGPVIKPVFRQFN